ncbi:uncharacterized protein J3D65DRAFT_693964 [Phyllosticta citribraziliensis]|uniref:Uncharacterized protein n=1 Tax=Phyllosticta citribraziliensis TaxID=989973 RepID=A0ABR1LY06_9PEZI
MAVMASHQFGVLAMTTIPRPDGLGSLSDQIGSFARVDVLPTTDISQLLLDRLMATAYVVNATPYCKNSGHIANSLTFLEPAIDRASQSFVNKLSDVLWVPQWFSSAPQQLQQGDAELACTREPLFKLFNTNTPNANYSDTNIRVIQKSLKNYINNIELPALRDRGVVDKDTGAWDKQAKHVWARDDWDGVDILLRCLEKATMPPPAKREPEPCTS